MATLSDKNEIKAAVIHVLAGSSGDLSPGEIANVLSIKPGLVSRALFEAKREKPPMVSVSEENKNKFTFVGDRDFLDPLPENVGISVKSSGKKVSNSPLMDASEKPPEAKTYQSKKVSLDLSDIDTEVLGLFQDRKKIARSSIQDKLEKIHSVSEIDQSIDTMVRKGYFSKTTMDEFDEDILDVTDIGENVISALSELIDKPVQKPEELSVAKIRKFPGRPSGARDFSLLRKKILDYVALRGDVSKSNVAKNISLELDNFGRATIGKEFLNLISDGSLEVGQDDSGNQRPGLYRIANKSAEKVEPEVKKAETKKQPEIPDVKDEKRPLVKEAAPVEQPKEPAKVEKPKEPAKVEFKMDSQKVKGLKYDLQRVIGEDTPGLSSEIGGLFDRVLEYVEELEGRVERLRSISKDVIDRI
jgi:DNA-binding MarR family transcriptional regulator